MSTSTLISAFFIACVFVGWPIIGKYSNLTGEYVGTLACLGTLGAVAAMSAKQLFETASLTIKAVTIMMLAGIVNGVGVYYYARNSADKLIPTADFVATVCIFMVVLAPLEHWYFNGVVPSWRQFTGYGFAAIAVYFLK